jgi:DnaD/phage-associated family protein
MRYLDPGIVTDEYFGTLGLLSRCLWIGLIVVCADDQGRVLDNSTMIRNQVFPFDDYRTITINEVELALLDYAKHLKIVRYQVGTNGTGKHVIQIVNWWKYQRSASFMSASKYPPPDGWVDRCRYHTTGNQIIKTNWEDLGGFVGSTLPSQLLTPYPSLLPRRDVNDDVNDDVNVNGDGDNTTTSSGGVFKTYEAEIGLLTPKIKDTVNDYIDRLKIPPDWIKDAIHIAADNNKRNWAYCAAIIKRWSTEGRNSTIKKSATIKDQGTAQNNKKVISDLSKEVKL